MSIDKAGLFLLNWRILAPNEVKPISEYRFCDGRRYRLDFAFVEHKIGIEVDGGQWSPRGGRHNTDADRAKMNLLAELGWRVFRFSPDMLKRDPQGCIDQVRRSLQCPKG